MKKLLAGALLVLTLCTFSAESNAYCGYSGCWHRPRYTRMYHHRRHHWNRSCRVRNYRYIGITYGRVY